MGLILRGIDRLPKWAKWIVFLVGVVCCIYGIARYGFWHFMLRAIFSPDI